MFVAVQGRAAGGEPIERSWHLLAEGDDGPLIPSMAVEAIVRKLLDGAGAAARCAARDRELELADYERLFARRSIDTGVRERLGDGPPCTRACSALRGTSCRAEIRAMHDLRGEVDGAAARPRVERGAGLLARLAAAAVRVPAGRRGRSGHGPLRGYATASRLGRAPSATAPFSSVQFAGRGPRGAPALRALRAG